MHPLSFPAQMAKLVDALVSGTSVSNDVQVRVLFWAQKWRSAQSTERRTKKPELLALSPQLLCPDGEIGRHASLRGWCRLRCASSSLVLGTKKRVRNSSLFYFKSTGYTLILSLVLLQMET